MRQNQIRVLNEFEAIGNDLLDIVTAARESEAQLKAMRAKMEAKRQEEPSRAYMAIASNPSLFLPELDYMIDRLDAIKTYLTVREKYEDKTSTP